MPNIIAKIGQAISQFIGFVPCEGPKALPLTFDFSLNGSYSVDLTQIQQQGDITSIQAIYIDNADNTEPLEIDCNVSNQRVIIPAGAQAYVPLLQPNPPSLTFISTSTLKAYVQLLNFFVPATVWFAQSFSFTPTGALVVSTNPTTVTMVDHSGTIAVGGVAQVLLTANPARKRFFISNPSTAIETLQFMYGLATNGPITLGPGQTWDESGETVSSDEIWIVAATTAHAFASYEA